MTMLGLLEAFDRNGALLGRMPVHAWPVTVGRALSCDLVLDDPHVAPAHLRIARTETAAVAVDVLETRNGVVLGRAQHAAGTQFDWPQGSPLEIGRLRVVLRLADAPLAPEQSVPRFGWMGAALTALALIGVVAVALAMAWLGARDAAAFLQTMPKLLMFLLMSLGVWCGLWALANKMFAHQLNFWRHVRIASATYLAVELVAGAANLVAYSMSWESLARFDHLFSAVVAAIGVYAHLALVLPRRRAGLAWSVGVLFAVTVAASLGANWLDKKRLSDELYMSGLFPPMLRVAKPVTVDEWIDEAGALRERLEQRSRDAAEEDGAPDDEGEDAAP